MLFIMCACVCVCVCVCVCACVHICNVCIVSGVVTTGGEGGCCGCVRTCPVFVDGCVCRSLGQFSILFGQVVRGMSAGARVFEYMDLRPGMPVRGGVVLPNMDIQGEVKFRDVTFAYPTRKEQVCCPFACGCMSV